MSDKKPFAYFEGEDPEQTEAYITGLEVDLAGRRQRGEDEADVLRELARMGKVPSGGEKRSGRQARPRTTVETRES